LSTHPVQPNTFATPPDVQYQKIIKKQIIIMPPQQAWASRQFQDCDSDGKSRAVQCKWCIEKKVAYNSTSRKTSHLKQCAAFTHHVVQLVEAENAGGYLCRELQQMPLQVLDSVLDLTTCRRLQQQQQQQGGEGHLHQSVGETSSPSISTQTNAVLFGNNSNNNTARLPFDTPRTERSAPSSSTLRTNSNNINNNNNNNNINNNNNGTMPTPQQSHPSLTSTPITQSARSNAYNKAQVDRAFASAMMHPAANSPALQHLTPDHSSVSSLQQDVSGLLGTPSSSTPTQHLAISDALRLLDKDTRERIARDLLTEAYDEVKRAVDNYVQKKKYLGDIVDDGVELGVGDHGL
jgi:hypothetical protein